MHLGQKHLLTEEQDRRVFIKDMAYFMIPQGDSRAVTAASFSSISKQGNEDAMRGNHTTISLHFPNSTPSTLNSQLIPLHNTPDERNHWCQSVEIIRHWL